MFNLWCWVVQNNCYWQLSNCVQKSNIFCRNLLSGLLFFGSLISWGLFLPTWFFTLMHCSSNWVFVLYWRFNKIPVCFSINLQVGAIAIPFYCVWDSYCHKKLSYCQEINMMETINTVLLLKSKLICQLFNLVENVSVFSSFFCHSSCVISCFIFCFVFLNRCARFLKSNDILFRALYSQSMGSELKTIRWFHYFHGFIISGSIRIKNSWGLCG